KKTHGENREFFQTVEKSNLSLSLWERWHRQVTERDAVKAPIISKTYILALALSPLRGAPP
ncbi:MAG: hypothetical protein IJX27_05700, partial [Clostridia bacterium]|nr:hypothetical protein [Clostridia bacterium]